MQRGTSADTAAGGLSTFNLQHGFIEALLRGYRSGFLDDMDYHHLTQCESVEDVKLNLQETDYDQFLSDTVAGNNNNNNNNSSSKKKQQRLHFTCDGANSNDT